MSVNPNEEFVIVHQEQLERIAAMASLATYNHPERLSVGHRVIEDNDSFVILEGKATSDSIGEAYRLDNIGLASEDAEKIAEIRNIRTINIARLNIITLNSFASMVNYVELVQAKEAKSEDGRRLLDYERAYHMSGEWLIGDYKLYAEESHLLGLERLEVAAHNLIRLVDGEIATDLDVNRIGEPGVRTLFISSDTYPAHDELRTRIARLFDENLARLILYMGGDFISEEELDEDLAGIRNTYEGTAKEAEISLILEEVRARAIAAKASWEIAPLSNLNIPTIEQMQQFSDVLGELFPNQRDK
jgi:hypothetical protein